MTAPSATLHHQNYIISRTLLIITNAIKFCSHYKEGRVSQRGLLT